MRRKMPVDVIIATRVKEQELHAFYEHLQAKVNELKSQIKSGKL